MVACLCAYVCLLSIHTPLPVLLNLLNHWKVTKIGSSTTPRTGGLDAGVWLCCYSHNPSIAHFLNGQYFCPIKRHSRIVFFTCFRHNSHLSTDSGFHVSRPTRCRRHRIVANCTGLLILTRFRVRGFESHCLRNK